MKKQRERERERERERAALKKRLFEKAARKLKPAVRSFRSTKGQSQALTDDGERGQSGGWVC